MSEEPQQLEDYRLPRDVSPIHYDLKILTDLDDLQFEGIVDIQYAFPVRSRTVANSNEPQITRQ